MACDRLRNLPKDILPGIIDKKSNDSVFELRPEIESCNYNKYHLWSSIAGEESEILKKGSQVHLLDST